MKVYETTFIINPQADDATIDRQVKAVTDLVTGNGGKILHEDRMGTRRLAYEINGLTQGYYTSIVFESEAAIPSTLERHYRLEEPYMRHLTILFEGDLEKLKERAAAPMADEVAPSVPPARPVATEETAAKETAESSTEEKPEAEAASGIAEATPAPAAQEESGPDEDDTAPVEIPVMETAAEAEEETKKTVVDAPAENAPQPDQAAADDEEL